MGNVEVRKNKEGYELNLNTLIYSELLMSKEGYELNLNTLIYSELLMSNVRFLVTNQICRVLP